SSASWRSRTMRRASVYACRLVAHTISSNARGSPARASATSSEVTMERGVGRAPKGRGYGTSGQFDLRGAVLDGHHPLAPAIDRGPHREPGPPSGRVQRLHGSPGHQGLVHVHDLAELDLDGDQRPRVSHP